MDEKTNGGNGGARTACARSRDIRQCSRKRSERRVDDDDDDALLQLVELQHAKDFVWEKLHTGDWKVVEEVARRRRRDSFRVLSMRVEIRSRKIEEVK